MPSTLEGRIVRFADRIAYINHDIDDALRAGLDHRGRPAQGPLRALGGTGGDRIDGWCTTWWTRATRPATIVQSPGIAEAMDDLADFLFQTVYPQSLQRAGEQRVRHVITNLMQYFLEHPGEMGQESRRRAAATASIQTRRAPPTRRPAARWRLVQAVTDYISGMTDRYAISRYRELFEPRSWAAT